MITPRDILLGFTAPLIAALVLVLPLRRRALAGALGAAVAYVLGHVLLIGPGAFQPIDVYNWLIYAVLAAGLVGIAESSDAVPRAVVWLGRAAVSGAMMLVTLKPLVPHALSTGAALAWGAAIAALVLLVWSASTHAAETRRGAALPGAWVIVVGAAALAVGFTGSQKMMQLGGAMVAGLLPVLAVAVARCDRAPARSAAGPAIVLAVGLLANGRFYSELPDWAALVIAITPLVALLRLLPVFDRIRSWAATLITLGLVALPAVIVLIPLLRKFIEALNDPYR